jgi:hypothetical protein
MEEVEEELEEEEDGELTQEDDEELVEEEAEDAMADGTMVAIGGGGSGGGDDGGDGGGDGGGGGGSGGELPGAPRKQAVKRRPGGRAVYAVTVAQRDAIPIQYWFVP